MAVRAIRASRCRNDSAGTPTLRFTHSGDPLLVWPRSSSLNATPETGRSLVIWTQIFQLFCFARPQASWSWQAFLGLTHRAPSRMPLWQFPITAPQSETEAAGCGRFFWAQMSGLIDFR